MLYSCTHMATLGVKGLLLDTRGYTQLVTHATCRPTSQVSGCDVVAQPRRVQVR